MLNQLKKEVEEWKNKANQEDHNRNKIKQWRDRLEKMRQDILTNEGKVADLYNKLSQIQPKIDDNNLEI